MHLILKIILVKKLRGGVVFAQKIKMFRRSFPPENISCCPVWIENHLKVVFAVTPKMFLHCDRNLKNCYYTSVITSVNRVVLKQDNTTEPLHFVNSPLCQFYSPQGLC